MTLCVTRAVQRSTCRLNAMNTDQRIEDICDSVHEVDLIAPHVMLTCRKEN